MATPTNLKPVTPTTGSRRADAKPNESKRDRFVRLGGARMGKVLKGIEGLGNLSGAAYEYSEADVSKMRTAIQNATDAALRRFDPNAKRETKATFSF